MRRKTVGVSAPQWVLASCLIAALPRPIEGQTPAANAEVVFSGNQQALFEGWYVVRPGDTLRGITARYLGDESRWNENWRINPEVSDPDRLTPGQRLRILFKRLPEDGAVVSKIANQVQGQLLPLSWEDARELELLRSRDGLRTYKRSSAALLFADNTRLTVSEESLVFLESQKGEADRIQDEIEIQLGQADFEGKSSKAARGDIDIVIGGVRAAPKPSATGEVRTRARRPDQGGAHLMVYEGESEVAAAGQRVQLPRGTGSVTEAGKAPGPAETLLEAPQLLGPAGEVAHPRPQFQWSPVTGAASYTLELCGDVECGRLLERLKGLTSTSWKPEAPMALASYFWRVTAISASGLDGYPAPASQFTITSAVEDETAPIVRLKVEGPSLSPRYGMNRHYILGQAARLGAIALDDQGVPVLTCTLDGVATADEQWRGPWAPGRHRAACEAVDAVGNRGELPAFEFVYDTEPPIFHWGADGKGKQGELRKDAYQDLPRQPARQKIVTDDPHSFWPWRRLEFTVEHDSRQLVLRPNRAVVLEVDGQTIDLEGDQALWILASDTDCESLSAFDYQIELEVVGSFWRKRLEGRLRLEGLDWVDNGATAELRFVSKKKP